MSGKRQPAVWRIGFVGVVAGAAAGILGIATALVYEEPREGEVQDAGEPTRYTDHIASTGDGLDVEAAMDLVMAGMDSSMLRDVRVVQPPSSAPDSSPDWIEVTAIGTMEEPGTDVELTWQAATAQGAIADLVRTDQVSTNQVIGGMYLLVADPSGSPTVPLDGGSGYVAAGQVFGAQDHPRDDSAIVQDVISTVERFGLKDVSVDVMHPLGPAVSVLATLPRDLDVTWTIDGLRDAISSTPRAYEAVYVEIRAATGEPLLKSGVAYRTGLGGLWFAEGQDEVFGATHGGSASLEGAAG